MTDRLKGLVVALVSDIREDDANAIINAIKMIRGVLDVTPSLSDSNDWMNRRRIQNELEEKLWKALHEGNR